MATLYVNSATGDDSRTKVEAANSATPWETIYRAAKGCPPGGSPTSLQAASAGDIVMVAAGTYNIDASGNRFIPAYNPVNSGSSGSPITFRGYTSEALSEGSSASSVRLTQTPGDLGPLIGASGVDYIVWEGFYINEEDAHNRPDTALITVHDTVGTVIQHNEVHGMIYPYISLSSTLSSSPGTSGLTFTMSSMSGPIGTSSLPFGIAVWDDATDYPIDGQVEYMMVTGRSGSTLTVTRAQLWSSAKNVVAGWRVGLIGTDNHSGVRVENSVSCTVQNNRLHGFGTINSDLTERQGHNQSGVIIYDSQSCIFEHNEIYDCGGGVFPKGNNSGQSSRDLIIRFNLIHDVGQGLPGISMFNSRVYQNIVYNAQAGVTWEPVGDGTVEPWPTNSWYFNNTFYNIENAVCSVSSGPVSSWGAGNRFWNNICWGSSVGTGGAGRMHTIDGQQFPNSTTNLSYQHNVYHTFAQFSTDSLGNHTLQQMKDNYNQEEDSLASISVNPGFVNAAAGDFHLTNPATVSVGHAIGGVGGAGGTTIPAGAYITGDEEIGINGAEGSPSVPSGQITVIITQLHG